MNQAAITIQRWYRRHAKRQHVNQTVLKRILASKKKVSTRSQAVLGRRLILSWTETIFRFSGMGGKVGARESYEAAKEKGREQKTGA